jgi:hypothetical protein
MKGVRDISSHDVSARHSKQTCQIGLKYVGVIAIVLLASLLGCSSSITSPPPPSKTGELIIMEDSLSVQCQWYAYEDGVHKGWLEAKGNIKNIGDGRARKVNVVVNMGRYRKEQYQGTLQVGEIRFFSVGYRLSGSYPTTYDIWVSWEGELGVSQGRQYDGVVEFVDPFKYQ